MDDGLFGPLLGGPPLVHDLETLAEAVQHQRGLVTTAQCVAAGLSDDVLRHRLRIGRWVTMRRGVHLTVPGREGWWFDATSALLSVGHGAAWCFGTAAFAQRLVRTPPRSVHLLVDAAYKVRSPPGVVVHRSRHAQRRVDALHWPWRTTPEETVLDLAERASVDDLAVMLGRAFSRGVTSQNLLLSRLDERSRHRQRSLIVEMVTDVAQGAESAIEVRFLRDVVRPHGLPLGRRQAPTAVRGIRVHDVAYDDQRVLVELDGRLGHDDEGRVRDGVRDRAAPRSGGSPSARSGATWRARPATSPGSSEASCRDGAGRTGSTAASVATARSRRSWELSRARVREGSHDPGGGGPDRRCVAYPDFVTLDLSRRRKPGLDLTGPGPFVRSTP